MQKAYPGTTSNRFYFILFIMAFGLKLAAAAPIPGRLGNTPGSGEPPAAFIENRGQWADPSLHYALCVPSAQVGVMDGGLCYQLLRRPEGNGSQPKEIRRFTMKLQGASPTPAVGLDRSGSTFNFLRGDISRWREDVASWSQVGLRNVYPGIDMTVAALPGGLKYEFRVAPGAAWRRIRLAYEGVQRLDIGRDGRLNISPAEGYAPLAEDAPYIYQERADGTHIPVAGRFVLLGKNVVSFEIPGPLDPALPLVIDPVQSWGTYVGGGNNDEILDMTTDASGNLIACGWSDDPNEWVSGGYDLVGNGKRDGFVIKVSPAGQHLWSTFMGGTDDDEARGVATDASGNVYVCGKTLSTGWVTSDLDNVYHGSGDAWAARLSASGAHVWSRYLGGTGADVADGISWYGNKVYVCGTTASAAWVKGDVGYHAGDDAFVTRLDETTNARDWLKYIGGDDSDEAFSIKAYASGVVFCGSTQSTGWVSGGYDTVIGGSRDGYAAKMTTAGAMTWSTYLGGSSNDEALGITVDSLGYIVVCGMTMSTGWISGGEFMVGGGNSGFLIRLLASGARSWSSYVPGTATLNGVAVNSARDIFAVGGSLPITDPVMDAVLVKFASTGSQVWKTTAGGNSFDYARRVALDNSSNVFIGGVTKSGNWLPGGYDQTINLGTTSYYDGFIAKIRDSYGSLRVTADAAAAAAGATWRRTGTATWLSSGATESNLPTGPYQVEFSVVNGYDTPLVQSTTVTENQTAQVTGTYVRHTGSLRVTLLPAEAVTAGARWRRVGTLTWLGSAVTESGVPTGEVEYEFLAVAGWSAPPHQVQTVVRNTTSNCAGTYVRQTGSLQVDILPPELGNLGHWRRQTSMDWLPGGYLESDIPTGPQIVIFQDAAGWDTPPSKAVTVLADQKAVSSGTYVRQYGSCKTTITTAEVLPLGAKWCLRNQTGWLNSDAVASNIPAGSYYLDLSFVMGWTADASRLVTIVKNATTQLQGAYTRDSGRLKVNLVPQGALDQGAAWTLDGAGSFSSGTTLDRPTGDYTIGFVSTADWEACPDQSVSLTKDTLLTKSGTYTRARGSLKTIISPPEVVAAGAMWRRAGTVPYLGSGVVENDLPTGSYNVELSPVSGWTGPTLYLSGDVTRNQTTTLQGSYTRQVGYLKVTLEPPNAVTAGGRWRRVGTLNWLESDATESNVPTGDYEIQFKSTMGWNSPPNQTVTVMNGLTRSTNATYERQKGSLKVNIAPPAVVDIGAVWQFLGELSWSAAGTVSDLPTTDYTVTFLQLNGWDTPGNQTVSITPDATTEIYANYVQQVGALHVSIAPPEAVAAGAKWRRGGNWLDANTTETGIAIGSYMVEFSDVAGWNKPSNTNATIQKNSTRNLSVNYTRQTGSLAVTILPAGAVTAGARWHRVGTVDWLTSGQIENNIPTGDVQIEFKTTTGWVSPSNQSVAITNNGSATAQATYQAFVPDTSSLKVTLLPAEAVSGGAKWRRTGTTPWLLSGETEAGAPVGACTVQFFGIPNWDPPNSQQVTLISGTMQSLEATYVRHTGALTVTLTPSGVIAAGAKWRRVGTVPWFASGATESAIPTTDCQVEFFPIPGYTIPSAKPVSITKGATATASGAYTLDTGSLTVTLAPPGAITDGTPSGPVGDRAPRRDHRRGPMASRRRDLAG